MNKTKRLNVKRTEAYELAARLAAMTGESLTAVVIAALREKVELLRKARARD